MQSSATQDELRSGLLEQRLREHVRELADDVGERHIWRPGSLGAAARYIRSEWESQGHTIHTLPCYTLKGEACANLEIVIRGTASPEVIIVAGAHYDTVQGSPGADDNASGVATVLELSRLLKNLCPARTLKLVAFVNEEAPFFHSSRMGSAFYARAARARGDDISLMLSFEMLGCYLESPGTQSYPPLLRHFYPDRGDFIAFVSNLAGRQALRQTVKVFRACCDFPCESLAAPAIVPGVSWSDQFSFWRAGYKALMVTDTAFYRNACYHTAQDTAEKLNYSSMAQVVDGLARTLRVLAEGKSMGPAARPRIDPLVGR